MEELASELVEQLDCVAVFSVNIGGYEIPIYESIPRSLPHWRSY